MKLSVIARILLTFPALAAPAQHNRITGRVDNTRRATLKGHVHPLALAANDQGRADATLQLPRVTLVLRPSDAPAGGSESTARGAAGSDFAELSSVAHAGRIRGSFRRQPGRYRSDDYLAAGAESHGGGCRPRPQFDRLQRHRRRSRAGLRNEDSPLQVDGELHFANATDPSIPAAFRSVVASIHGLNDFRLKPKSQAADRRTTPR